jgi:hypothetical protein
MDSRDGPGGRGAPGGAIGELPARALGPELSGGATLATVAANGQKNRENRADNGQYNLTPEAIRRLSDLKGAPMSRSNAMKESERNGVRRVASKQRTTIVLEVDAAYNRDRLPLPEPNGPGGRRMLNIEMLINHPFYWEWLNERETGEVLMELYMARTRLTQ